MPSRSEFDYGQQRQRIAINLELCQLEIVRFETRDSEYNQSILCSWFCLEIVDLEREKRGIGKFRSKKCGEAGLDGKGFYILHEPYRSSIHKCQSKRNHSALPRRRKLSTEFQDAE